MNTRTLVADIESALDGTPTDFTAGPDNTTRIVVNADISPAETGGGNGNGNC